MTDRISKLQIRSLEGRTVLVADDDPSTVFAMKKMLKKQGVTVITAINGQEAIDTLEEEDNHIELVLMDIMMPVMDGLTAMRLLRNNPLFITLPIIALTARNLKYDRDECMTAGASDYLAKPASAESILKMLDAWFWAVDEEKSKDEMSAA